MTAHVAQIRNRLRAQDMHNASRSLIASAGVAIGGRGRDHQWSSMKTERYARGNITNGVAAAPL